MTTSFVDGARDLLGVALIIGIARGITVIMNNGEITDTVLHWIESALGDTGEVWFLILMFLLFLPLSFVIPSTSGLATLAMPIIAPLAGFIGVSTALVVTAYQGASGVMNLVVPTSAVVMGGLAIARVPYGTYLRWVWPLLVLLSGLSVRRARRRSRPVTAAWKEGRVRRGTEWLLIVAAALLVVGLIAYARGPKHHHGDEVGTHGTKIVDRAHRPLMPPGS